MDLSEKKLNFYKNMYEQIEKLEKLYNEFFSLDKIKVDMISSNYILNNKQKRKEYEQLVSLESVILATMIGLNREKLESANSKTNNRSLFQYKDYESSMKIFFNDSYFESGYDVSKKMCDAYNFNKDKTGPFPYMLEIINDDNKNRPYDYISKIRNALLHGEYYLETPEILHITNHDENGNITFEGKLLMFSFEMFVIDFFGTNTLNSSFQLYNFLDIEKFEKTDDLVDFLSDFICFNIEFTKIPDSYKFKGQDALYTRLNSCFGLDTIEKTNIIDELNKLVSEGVEYKATGHQLTKDQKINIGEYIFERYNNVYNNKNIIGHVQALLKLQIYPISEITNCLGNMLTYISCKKDFLLNNKLTNTKLLEELKNDEYCDTAFKYALTFLKANVINYAIECEEFENLDLSLLDINDFAIDNSNEFERRKNNFILDGLNEKEAINKLVLETIRNSLAHGSNRINISIEKDLKTYLIDIYPNVPNLGMEFSLDLLNKIFSNEVFKPENIKLKNNKVLKKI